MLILLSLLVGLSLGQSENLSSQIEVSINRTIDTVEKLIKNDPSLPKLSRYDILNILQNITTGNAEFNKIEKMTRDAYQRALMVVLPHSTNTSQNLKELYTKSPLVHMIPDSVEADAMVEVGKTEEIIFPPNPKDPSPFAEKPEKLVAESSAISATNTSFKVECQTVNENNLNNHREFYSELQKNLSLPNTITSNADQEKFTFNLSNLDQIAKSAQEYLSSTKWPMVKNSLDKKPSSSNDEKVAVVYSSSVTPKPSTKIYDKSTSSSNHPIPYDFQNNVLRSNAWKYFKPETMNNENVQKEQNSDKYVFLPTMSNLPGNINNYFELPKKIAGNNSKVEESERPAPVYVTPLSSTSDKKLNLEHETTMKNNMPATGGFSIATKIETSVKPMNIIESLGLNIPKIEGDRNEDFNIKMNFTNEGQQDSSGSRFNLPLDIVEFSKKLEPALLHPYNSENTPNNLGNMLVNKELNFKNTNVDFNKPVGLTTFDLNSPSIAKQNTFQNAQSEYRKGVENLSPDIRILFQRFGLPISVKDILTEKVKPTTTTTTTKRPTTTPSYVDSFTSFKRLPSSMVENKEMRDFLAQFGLGNVDKRIQKAMKSNDYVTQPTRHKPSTFDMRKALDNIGLLALVPRSDEVTTRPKVKYNAPKLHVFKPHETTHASKEQKEKIHKLLNTVKMVQEGKVQDVEKVVSDLVQTTKSLKSGPDPVDLDEILKLYNEEMRHDKKRQRQAIYEDMENQSSTSTTSTEITTMMETETMSEETVSVENTESFTETSTTSKNFFDNFDINSFIKTNDSDAKSSSQPDNFAALEESFGGSTAAPDPVIPTRPRTGLYFLVDWNSFLEVGEDGKDKVNLRFQPKVGDRSRFIPIKIP